MNNLFIYGKNTPVDRTPRCDKSSVDIGYRTASYDKSSVDIGYRTPSYDKSSVDIGYRNKYLWLYYYRMLHSHILV